MAAPPKQYVIVYKVRNYHTRAITITAESYDEAVNIPLFRSSEAEPELVFVLPSGPGPASAENVHTVGTQQWKVE